MLPTSVLFEQMKSLIEQGGTVVWEFVRYDALADYLIVIKDRADLELEYINRPIDDLVDILYNDERFVGFQINAFRTKYLVLRYVNAVAESIINIIVDELDKKVVEMEIKSQVKYHHDRSA